MHGTIYPWNCLKASLSRLRAWPVRAITVWPPRVSQADGEAGPGGRDLASARRRKGTALFLTHTCWLETQKPACGRLETRMSLEENYTHGTAERPGRVLLPVRGQVPECPRVSGDRATGAVLSGCPFHGEPALRPDPAKYGWEAGERGGQLLTRCSNLPGPWVHSGGRAEQAPCRPKALRGAHEDCTPVLAPSEYPP